MRGLLPKHACLCLRRPQVRPEIDHASSRRRAPRQLQDDQYAKPSPPSRATHSRGAMFDTPELIAARRLDRTPGMSRAERYIDRNGVKRRTGPSASPALSSGLGSPSSSPKTSPVARIA